MRLVFLLIVLGFHAVIFFCSRRPQQTLPGARRHLCVACSRRDGVSALANEEAFVARRAVR